MQTSFEFWLQLGLTAGVVLFIAGIVRNEVATHKSAKERSLQ